MTKSENPFAANHLLPGAKPYLGSMKLVDECIERLVQHRRTYQVVGPHGCGKTTLTVELARRLRSRQQVGSKWVTLRRRGPFSYPTSKIDNYLEPGTATGVKSFVFFVDGIECLSTLQRRIAINALARRHQVVVTSHRMLAGYPVLARLSPNLEQFMRLCEQRVSPDWHPEWTQDVEHAFTKCGGDYREGFFELYDRYSQRLSERAQEKK